MMSVLAGVVCNNSNRIILQEGEKYLLSAVALNPKEARYYANLGERANVRYMYHCIPMQIYCRTPGFNVV